MWLSSIMFFHMQAVPRNSPKQLRAFVLLWLWKDTDDARCEKPPLLQGRNSAVLCYYRVHKQVFSATQ
jgi:hypothetical protein